MVTYSLKRRMKVTSKEYGAIMKFLKENATAEFENRISTKYHFNGCIIRQKFDMNRGFLTLELESKKENVLVATLEELVEAGNWEMPKTKKVEINGLTYRVPDLEGTKITKVYGEK